MIDKRIKFEEAHYNDGLDLFTIYYTAPADVLGIKKRYPDAVSGGISLEFSTHHNSIESRFAYVEISPTKAENNSFIDYDWREVSLSIEDIEELIKLAKEAGAFDKNNLKVNCKL